jgi:hypothetical protein
MAVGFVVRVMPRRGARVVKLEADSLAEELRAAAWLAALRPQIEALDRMARRADSQSAGTLADFSRGARP